VDRRADAYARLFERVPEGAYVGTLHQASSATLAVNAHLKRILGYPLDAADESVRPFDPDRFVDPAARTSMLQRLDDEGAVTDLPIRLRRADDTAVWIELTARAEPAAPDGALRVEALVRDVTHRRNLDDQTRDLAVQALQDEKMAALGQTISGVAHELNNPLATILSWAERLTQQAAADDPARRGLETILRESERAARIVRNLLTFARKRQTTRAMVDVNQIVRDTLALRADKHRASHVDVVDALALAVPPVFADEYQLQQVLLNLVINAEQAMIGTNGRGVLAVRSWHDADQESVAVEIADDGPGMAEDVRAKIFDPFFTTKEVGKGTGLGLTVAYAIVQEHGGTIRVSSRPGAGAVFVIEMPLIGAARRSPAPPPRPPSPVAAAPAGGAILVVEDETALATAVIEMLEDAGYEVEHAGNGEEALARVTTRAFDLVICDLKMPRVDGQAFYRALATRAPAMTRRVIFVTGDVAGTDAERFLSASGCRWLAKPFRSADLLRSVRDALG
jgi:two-component system, cell cycle sensor histidine kinase and response regulator CckA